MPLYKGKRNIGKNINELEDTGRPKKQALAIALNVAGEANKPGNRMKKIGVMKSKAKTKY